MASSEEWFEQAEALRKSGDWEEAAHLYRQAGEAGHASAQYCFGYCCECGKGEKKDLIQALEWYYKAAVQGNERAVNKLTSLAETIPETAKEVQKKYEQAVSKVSELEASITSCRKKLARDEKELPTLGFFKNSRKKELKKEIYSLQDKIEAAEEALPRAKREMTLLEMDRSILRSELQAMVHLFNRLREEIKEREKAEQAEKAYEQGRTQYNAGKYAEALPLLRAAAEAGKAEAQYYMGVCLLYGRGTETDAAEAVSWYRKAAEQGYADAQNSLGYCYGTAAGVALNYAEAAKWYRKAAEQGQMYAQSNLGMYYYNGRGVAVDYAEAYQWFQRSADQGYAVAEDWLGICCENGRGTEKDPGKAAEWYKKAAEQGNAWGQDHFGNMYEYGKGVKQDLSEAVKWYEKAAAQGHENAKKHLETCRKKNSEAEYQKGKSFLDARNYDEAVPLLRRAAEAGKAEAQYYLGNCYHFSQGVKQDYAEAVKWYRKAAEQGNADAQYSLGECCKNGRGVQQDIKKAIEWYEKAGAYSTIGRIYETGDGVKQDYRKALETYEKGEVWTELARMYMDGLGIDRDYAKAAELYKKAFWLSDEDKKRLAACEQKLAEQQAAIAAVSADAAVASAEERNDVITTSPSVPAVLSTEQAPPAAPAIESADMHIQPDTPMQSVNAKHGRRPKAIDPDAFITSIRALYPEGTHKTLNQVKEAHPELPWRTFMNSAPALFGTTLAQYLAREGILLSVTLRENKEKAKEERLQRMRELGGAEFGALETKEQVENLLVALKQRYEGKELPNMLKDLIADNRDLPVLRRLQRVIPQLYGERCVAFLEQRGLLPKKTELTSEEKIEQGLALIEERFKGTSPLPIALKDIREALPDPIVSSCLSLIAKTKGVSAAEFLRSRGLLMSEEDKLNMVIGNIRDFYSDKVQKPLTISEIKDTVNIPHIDDAMDSVPKLKNMLAYEYLAECGILPDYNAQLERLKELVSQSGQRYYTVEDLCSLVPDADNRGLDAFVKKKYGMPVQDYLLGIGALNEMDEAERQRRITAHLNAEALALQEKEKQTREKEAARLRQFHPDMPPEKLVEYYKEKYLDETQRNPYCKEVRPLSERTGTQNSAPVSPDGNGCYIIDGVLYSCLRHQTVTVAEGTEIIDHFYTKRDLYDAYTGDVEEYILPDSVRIILGRFRRGYSQDKPSPKMNIPKGYLLQKEFASHNWIDFLAESGPWHYSASLLDWVWLFLTQEDQKGKAWIEDECLPILRMDPDASAAAFMGLMSTVKIKSFYEKALRYLFGEIRTFSLPVLELLARFSPSKMAAAYVPVFSPAADALRQYGTLEGHLNETEAAFCRYYSYGDHKQIKQLVSSDPLYADEPEQTVQSVSVILSMHWEAWAEYSFIHSYDRNGHKNIMYGYNLIAPDIPSSVFEQLDRNKFLSFLEANSTKKEYRFFLLPLARYGTEKEIAKLISSIKAGMKGKAFDRERAENAVEALYQSNTKSAMLYFDRNGLLNNYAVMRDTDADCLRVNSMYSFGFDENGHKTYSLGQRTVELRLGSDMSLTLFDPETGKQLNSLPKRGSDPEAYEAALADLTDTKTQIRAAVRNLTNTLFDSFLSGQKTWSAVWTEQYLSNPVTKNIAKLLVWEQDGATFVLTDNGPEDEFSQVYALSESPVAVAHPMELAPETVQRWQKYFTAHQLKQPFAQIWEPVISFDDLDAGRYSSCRIPLYRFKDQEKRGLSLYMEYDHSYGFSQCAYIGINIKDCTAEWHLANNDMSSATLQSAIIIDEFSCQNRSRATNHIIGYLDRCTVYDRIAGDDISVLEHLEENTPAQINAFLKFATEKGSVKCIAGLLDYKHTHFPEADAMEEFTLEL